MKKFLIVIICLLTVIISGAAFPIYNFTKQYSYVLTGISLWLNVFFYIELGKYENKLLKMSKLYYLILLNLGVILSGMLFRYFLEFGEISNVYNFTLQNVLVHVLVTLTISVLSYLSVKKQ